MFMANNLPRSKQLAVLGALVEGCSIRSVERMLGVHRDTVMRLGVRMGNGCASLLDEVMIDLPCKRLELDELWAFIGKKQRHVKETDDATKGDCWTWVAIDAETSRVPLDTHCHDGLRCIKEHGSCICICPGCKRR